MDVSLRGYKYTNFIMVLLLYVYIFQPPVINKFFFIIVEFIIFIFIFFTRTQSLFKIFKLFKTELTILMIIIIYALFRDMFTGEIVYSDRFIAWGFQAFFFGAVILLYFENKKESLFSLIYWTSFVAALISLSLLLFPSFDNWYKSVDIGGIYEHYKNMEVRYRGYGISENLTFTYSVVAGLFAGVSLLLLKKSGFFIIPFFIFLIALMFNARIGFVALFYFILYLSLVRFDFAVMVRFFVFSFLLILFGYYYLLFMGVDLSTLIIFSNSDWVLDFFLDIFGSSDTNQPSTLSVIFGKFIIIPDESMLQLLLGQGISLFGRETNSSDMGWILQLNYGGILLLLLIMIFLSYCFYRLVKVLGLKHWYTGFFILLIIVLNTKGFIFAATPGGRLFFLLYMYFILENSCFKKTKKTIKCYINTS